MKIVCISDTHSKHKRIPDIWFPEGDVIVHAGDISTRGYLREIEEFCAWFCTLPYDHKIFIAGNHDWSFQENPEEIRKILSRYPNITYLQDSGIEIDGVKFWGSPWQPEFYNWAFNLKRGEEILQKWKLIPNDIDVLITHGPVNGRVDMVWSGEFVGCEMLLQEIHSRLNVKLHVCGHIHSAHGETFDGKTHYINASTLNERYEVQYRPIVYEIDTTNE
jgi:Icc-related predicted phosphoesterase